MGCCTAARRPSAATRSTSRPRMYEYIGLLLSAISAMASLQRSEEVSMANEYTGVEYKAGKWPAVLRDLRIGVPAGPPNGQAGTWRVAQALEAALHGSHNCSQMPQRPTVHQAHHHHPLHLLLYCITAHLMKRPWPPPQSWNSSTSAATTQSLGSTM